MTFSKEQQQHARKLFIEECGQKAWGAAYNADYDSTQHDKLMADYEKLKKEDADLEAQISAIDTAPDYHTKDNREKRKQLEHRRNMLARQQEALLRPKERPKGENVVDLMEALRRSVGREAAPAKGAKPAKKPRKAATGQKQMLVPIQGKKPAKEAAAKKPATGQRRKSA